MGKVKKIKQGDFDLRLIITGLHRTLNDVTAENKVAACDVFLRLIAIDKSLKPRRRMKVSFESV